MELETLETERLFLKKLTPETFTYIFENLPKAEIKKLLGLTTDAEFDKEKQKSEGGYVTYDRTIVAFLLVSKETNETIGRCGFHNWYKDHRRAELGYTMLKEEEKRKGYMGEAVKAIIAYGFNTMNLNRIEACIGPENLASQALVKRNGFTLEGHLRQHFVRDEIAGDSLIFSLLKEDPSRRRTERS
ncbi:GNAT family N-acetyltransferase [Flavobacterium wongokense]|uniref:GNAT family N-acetyltransferase n=1 Tax=Flavobacterium wongokense TaxID=2910674 RepID=UPI001F412ABA|nr:GNAT family protein [Flavobacterium sp. WG47]MCF6131613.1 GNAT family N-acetyltransferase [Flavobacterium sp. WG47]